MAKIEDAEQRRGIIAVCLSREKGRKDEVGEARLEAGHGMLGDFHAGTDRQISLLAEESIAKMREKGLKLKAGAFGENIVTVGLDLLTLSVGQKLKAGEAEIEITQIGKVCPNRCSIYYSAGDCIMPREGVFARVLKSGRVKAGDLLEAI